MIIKRNTHTHTHTHHSTVVQSVEGLVLLPDSLLEVEGPVKQALPVHKKRKITSRGQQRLVFATAGDKGIVRIWSTDSPTSTCLCSCLPLAPPTATPLHDSESHQTVDETLKEKEAAHVFTSLHLCQSLNAICGVTHDHNLVLYDLPQLTKGKQVSQRCASKN